MSGIPAVSFVKYGADYEIRVEEGRNNNRLVEVWKLYNDDTERLLIGLVLTPEAARELAEALEMDL